MYSRKRTVNPLLGVYYGIFTAVFIGLVVFLLILDQMKIIDEHILYALTGAGFFLSVAIALAATTNNSDDFYVSGRRIPAGLNGLILFVVSIGGVGLSGLTAAVFFLGMDAYGLMFGMFGGLILSGFLFAGFIRKSGVYTLPSFFEIRFRSRFAGFLSAIILTVPVVLFALAELSLIKFIGPIVFGVTGQFSLLIVLIVALLVLLPGGVRSMSWAQCALAIVVLLGLMIPLIIISLKITYLPLAQMTYGSLIDEISSFQKLVSDDGAEQKQLWSLLLKNDFHGLTLPFVGGERVFSGLDKVIMMIVVAFGLGAAPSIIVRSSMALNVFQARKSFAWGVALIGLLILSIPACAIFLQYLISNPQNQLMISDLPSWVNELEAFGLLSAKDLNGDGQLLPNELLFSRDATFIALPIVAELNGTMQSLGFAAVMAAALASFVGRVMTLSQLFSRDLHFQKSEMESDVIGVSNLLWTRGMMIVVACVLTWGASQSEFSSFPLFINGLVLCACSIFPVLFLSIWWKGMTKLGFSFGLLFGFSGGIAALFFTNFGLSAGPFGLSLFYMAAINILVVFFISIVVALIGPKPNGADLEVLMDLRTPGGEALYERLLRLAMPRRTSGGS